MLFKIFRHISAYAGASVVFLLFCCTLDKSHNKTLNPGRRKTLFF